MRPLALLLSLLCASTTLAQCSGGRCGIPSFPPLMPMPQPEPESYRWIETDDPNQIALYRGRVQLGNWRYAEGAFYRLTGDTFRVAECPVAAPPGAIARKKDLRDLVENQGIDVEMLRAAGRGTSINGRKVTLAEAIKAVEQGVPDDSHLWRLTIISPDESTRTRIRADYEQLAPELIPWRGKFLVQDYPPDSWAISPGFKRDGAVVIYLQTPAGVVLHRQDDYSDGAKGLAVAIAAAEALPRQTIEAIRKPGPYDAGKDKDLRKPLIKPAPDKPDPNQPTPSPLANVPGWAWIAGAIAALLALLKPKE